MSDKNDKQQEQQTQIIDTSNKELLCVGRCKYNFHDTANIQRQISENEVFTQVIEGILVCEICGHCMDLEFNENDAFKTSRT